MELQFKKEDIGKRLILELDPEQDEIAKIIGADRIDVIGTILKISDEYITIHAEIPVCDFWAHGGKHTVKQIPYSHIKNYKYI